MNTLTLDIYLLDSVAIAGIFILLFLYRYIFSKIVTNSTLTQYYLLGRNDTLIETNLHRIKS
jgi:hypothetical protein